MEKAFGVQVNEVAHVAPVQSIFFPNLGMFAVTVREVVKAQSKNTLSCGSGILEVQLETVVQAPPEVLSQCWSAGVVKVIPVFPPQSPLPPVMADKFQFAEPVAVMSRKSALLIDTEPAERILGVPITSEQTKLRLLVVAPLFNVNKLVMVKSASSSKPCVSCGVAGATVKL